MTRQLKATAIAGAEPVSAVTNPRRPSPLDDVPHAAARAVLERGEFLGMGPSWLCKASAYAIAAKWDGVAFKVFDWIGDCRGTYASWSAASLALAELAAEWERQD